MAIVKADAYGHGLLPVAQAALGAGADWLGVAQLAEAFELREGLDSAGIARDRAPILAWISTSGSDFESAIRADIDLSVSWTWVLDEVCAAARSCGRPARIHVKVDTGMSRAGSTLADLPELAQAVRAGTVRFLKRACAFSPKQDCVRRFATLLQPREFCGTRKPTTTWFARGLECMDFPPILQSQVLRNWD